ncbi:SH3 domain-containing protein [Paeniglutamicibacter sulfureus]|uniref:SH3 domain-containing protein n=1 Tax=Paeniglutamicibacter sulfureus TaxID=43666 RepID=UPI002665CF5F|nr:SH3 domain-containing protein [Paeniglutamicibacter sulfureus]MDO2936126.1 SH3 domain-containing protein [Paeniglutamicibacter sulfureus]
MTALALAVAVTGSSTGFVLPAAGQVHAPTTGAAGAAPMVLEPSAAATGIAAKKLNLKKVTTNNLNLRQGKSTRTRVLLTVPKNTTVTVTETSGTWSKTTYKGKTGWVSSRYLKNAPAAQKTAPKSQSIAHRYTTGFTTLRKTASAKSQSLGSYQRRAKVEFLSASGAWTKVKVSGKTGFMESTRLSKTNPAVVYRWLKSKQVVYKSTNNKSARVATAEKNAKVEWLRTGTGWTAIRTGKGNGWVLTSALANTAIKPTAPKKPTPKASYRWTTAKVNIRKGAGTSHKSLGLVPANERVTYLKTANGWSNIRSSKGTGWISNKYLDKTGQYSFAVYGTLRKGQSAYYILKGKTSRETKTTIASHSMYLQPNKTWLSYVIPSKKASDKVVVERMDIKPASYRATVANMDKWERFNPNKPLADQNYNRVLVTDKDGKKSWAYLGSKKIGKYLTKNGIRVTSGDYLKRF